MLVRPTPADGVILEELGAELCLMRLDTSDVLVLNRTAADIWLLADGDTTTEQLVSSLAAAYGVSYGDIDAQVAGVVDDLEQRGFLVEQPAGP